MNRTKNAGNANKSATGKPSPAQESAQSQSTSSRRKALKTALAGGAVITAGAAPAKWVAPVVNSVMLPAHATTSQTTGPWFGILDTDVRGTYHNPANQENLLYASVNNAKRVLGTVTSSIADTLIEPANAQQDPFLDFVCVTRTNNKGGIQVEVQFYTEDPQYAYTLHAAGTLGNAVKFLRDCGSEGPGEFDATFDERPDGALDYSFSLKGIGVGIVPQAPCNFPDRGCPPVEES